MTDQLEGFDVADTGSLKNRRKPSAGRSADTEDGEAADTGAAVGGAGGTIAAMAVGTAADAGNANRSLLLRSAAGRAARHRAATHPRDHPDSAPTTEPDNRSRFPVVCDADTA